MPQRYAGDQTQGPLALKFAAFALKELKVSKQRKVSKCGTEISTLAETCGYLFSIFLLSSFNSTCPIAPAPTLCGCEESVPQTPPTPTQVQSFNLGLTNQSQYSTSPARTTGPSDIHMDPRWARILSWDSDRLKRGERGLSFSKLIKLG